MYYFITRFVKDRGFGDFSAGLVAKSPPSQCREPGIDSWSEDQIPHAATKIPYATTKTKDILIFKTKLIFKK